MSNIETLFADQLGFTNVPECLRRLKRLTDLGLNDSAFTGIPEWIGELGNSSGWGYKATSLLLCRYR
jgi:hypothetical protein